MKNSVLIAAFLLPLLLQGCYQVSEKNDNDSKLVVTTFDFESFKDKDKDSKKDVDLYRDAVLAYSQCVDKIEKNKSLEKNKQVSCDMKAAKEKAVSLYYDVNFGFKKNIVVEQNGGPMNFGQKTKVQLLKKYGYNDQVGGYNGLLFYLLMGDGDINNAANIYGESQEYFDDKDAKAIMTAKILKNIDKVEGKNLPPLYESLKKQGYVYEPFLVNTVFVNARQDAYGSDYIYQTKKYIIKTLERFNCYNDSALWLNYFVKSGERDYDEFGDQYNQIMGSMNKEQIDDMNKKVRDYLKNGQTPPISSTCEINAYKQLDF